MSGVVIDFDGEAAFQLELLPDQAPRTVAAIEGFVEAGPSTRALHVMYDGPAMMMAFPPDERVGEEIRGLELENASCYPQPGDAFWFRFPANSMPGQATEVWEIAIAYAPHVRLFSLLGWTPASVFGRVALGDIGRLAELGRSLRTDGARAVTARGAR